MTRAEAEAATPHPDTGPTLPYDGCCWRCGVVLWFDSVSQTTSVVKRYVKARAPLANFSFAVEDDEEGHPTLAAGGTAEGLRAEVVALLQGNPAGMTRGAIRNHLGKGRFGVKQVIDGLLRDQIVTEDEQERTRRDGKSYRVKVLILV